MKPRVLFLDHAGVLGGAELSLLDIARYYADSSRVLLFADGPFRKRLERAGVAVDVLPAPRAVSGIRREGSGIRELQAVPGALGLCWQVARLARGYDLLYTNSQKALAVGALAGKVSGKPVVWHLRDILTAEHFSRIHRRLGVALANRMVTRVIANSRATAKAFTEGGGQAERVRVVYNGISPEPFESVAPAEVDALRRALGLVGVPVVSAFSRLAPWKGQHVLLNALAHLPGIHALLVGEALFGESGYAKALHEQASNLRIGDRVHFLGFREDIPQLMRLSDLVVHTSTAPEPFGRTIVEGMLAHRPIVASLAGGIPEIVEDGVSGILVPPRDPEALAGALSYLLANPSIGHALAKAGRTTALERFSLQAMLKGVEQQIDEVAAPRQHNRRFI